MKVAARNFPLSTSYNELCSRIRVEGKFPPFPMSAYSYPQLSARPASPRPSIHPAWAPPPIPILYLYWSPPPIPILYVHWSPPPPAPSMHGVHQGTPLRAPVAGPARPCVRRVCVGDAQGVCVWGRPGRTPHSVAAPHTGWVEGGLKQ